MTSRRVVIVSSSALGTFHACQLSKCALLADYTPCSPAHSCREVFQRMPQEICPCGINFGIVQCADSNPHVALVVLLPCLKVFRTVNVWHESSVPLSLLDLGKGLYKHVTCMMHFLLRWEVHFLHRPTVSCLSLGFGFLGLSNSSRLFNVGR